jgi:hypothetical protein
MDQSSKGKAMGNLLLLQKSEARKTQTPSNAFLDVLRRHLAIFGEHYRQSITELSVATYAEDLADLTPEQLNAACIEARRTSEFMPVSATIRNCLSKIRSAAPVYLGPPMLAYPEVSQEERDEAMKFSEELKKKLGAPSQKSERPKLTVRPSLLSLEEQKRILREKGLLP